MDGKNAREVICRAGNFLLNTGFVISFELFVRLLKCLENYFLLGVFDENMFCAGF